MISKEKLIVRISGFGKNSVSKFWKNKKLNVLDMGYTLDIAGVRVICAFPEDIYLISDCFLAQADIGLIQKKD